MITFDLPRFDHIRTHTSVHSTTTLQVEEVFAANSVEEIIEKLEGRTERWAQIALHSISKNAIMTTPRSIGTAIEVVRAQRVTIRINVW